ncbi:unnamed protein product [Adineta steineri]|uniref:Phosphoinositide phospholipase C n=1 Tax=Adineta steineri TaxID=433720 RepID=A0A819C767_9BILA|nr:unnamed protein product [Adineta steineri]
MKSLSLAVLQIISPIFYLRCYSTIKMNDIKIEKFFVRDDEQFFPNNNQLPVIVYRQVFDTKSVSASKWEQLFQENNFGKSWRDGIFTYHHYHSTAHEALGCYGGHAQVRLGGDNEQVRKDIELNAGDCILIPTGVAHKNMGQDSEFGVVGAYDLDGKSYDMNYGKDAEERRKAEENMKKVQVPRMDPVVGKKNGGVIEFWQKNTHQNEILMTTDSTSLSEIQKTNVIDQLKRRVTFIKYKSNGRTYSRIYYVNLSEDAIHYQGSKRKSKHEACKIKDIGQIRRGFTTAVWKKYIDKRKITRDKAHLAFSILYDNNRHSLDLLADSENICLQWIQGLEYLIERYRSHVRTHHEITDRWLWSLFSQADRDQSGQLNRREVHQLLRLLNIELDEREIDQYFNQSNIRTSNYEELRNLDKDEFLLFYKFVSHRPELLKIICQYNGSTPEQIADTLFKYSILSKMPHTNPLEYPVDIASITCWKMKTKNISPQPEKPLTMTSDNNSSSWSSNTKDKKNYLTIEQFKNFLQNEEHMKGITIDDCSKLIARFEPSSEGHKYEELGVDGLRLFLLHDEFCLMNPDKSRRVYHDMTRPITDYFIATSHNTYIRDSQVYGNCTPETFIHALRTGCRAVEMDCYDGDNMEPIVYHAKTLTKPITLRAILHAIQTQAFTVSPYPLFLNIENHCSYEQQGVMARLLKNIFKDHLLTEPLMNDSQVLPSPEDLKYKVIIRSRRYPKGKIPADPKSSRSNDETEPNPKNYHPDFAKLIIYAQIVSYTNINHTMSTQKCFHSISFKESKADDLIKAEPPEHLDLIKLTNKHLVRVYPGTIRQNSSNINPVTYWTYGVQMAALNYQANDDSMCLQDGFFSDNGGCGYLLKPPCLLSNNLLFDPKEIVHKRGKRLIIHIISGQHLAKEKNSNDDSDIVDPYIEINTYGIECDYTQQHTPCIRNNGLNPIWDCKFHIDVYCPELCLVKFEVRDDDHYHRSAFVGQACFPFTALQLGYRHIKLKAKDGDYIRGTLFVHIKIENL